MNIKDNNNIFLEPKKILPLPLFINWVKYCIKHLRDHSFLTLLVILLFQVECRYLNWYQDPLQLIVFTLYRQSESSQTLSLWASIALPEHRNTSENWQGLVKLSLDFHCPLWSVPKCTRGKYVEICLWERKKNETSWTFSLPWVTCNNISGVCFYKNTDMM